MPPRQKITQAAWELHRQELRKLYLADGMGLDMIRTEMDKNYGFCPSKSQYETAFKKWNFRKNLSRSDWEFVGHRIKKRKADDKETEVYLNDTLIPSKRVKKELDRHFTPSYPQRYTTAPSPQTPPDIVVQTPKNPAIFEIRLDNLPWFQFQGFLESHTGFNQDFAARMSEAGGYQVHTPSVDLLAFPNTTRSTGSALDFSAQGDPNQLESRANIATPATSSIFAGLIPSSIKQESVEYIPTVHSYMQAISLERNPGDFLLSIQKLHGPFNRDALTEFLKFMAYLSSNNMLSEDKSDRFLRWVIETNHSTLREFFSVKMPTIEAFARCIFESALRINDAVVLQILLKAGVDPSPPTRMNGRTPLEVVVQDCNIKLTRILLDEGVDVNALSSDGMRTVLHTAVCSEYVAMVRMLLDAGADVNHAQTISVLDKATQTYNRDRAHHRTCDCDCHCDCDCDCDCDCNADARIVRILLNAGADVSAPVSFNPRRTALQAAAERGNVELAQLLLGTGADINAPGASPGSYDGQPGRGTVLQKVAGRGRYKSSIKLTRLLLDAGADINAPAGWDSDSEFDGQGITALQGAAKSGSVAMVQMLLDAGADVNAPAGWLDDDCYGMAALQLAAVSGSVEIVRMLLDAGAEANVDPELFDNDYSYGVTALQGAAKSGSVAMVQMLLDAGADVNAPAGKDSYESEEVTAFGLAVGSGSDELIQMLLVPDINTPTGRDPYEYEELTTLGWAARNGSVELVQMLLGAGADVNAPAGRDPYELTALGWAAGSGSVELVRMLLDAGADVNAPGCFTLPSAARAKQNNIALVQVLIAAGANVNAMDLFGRTALLVAIEKGHSVLVQVLLDAGADPNAFLPPHERTILCVAVERNDINLVRTLLDAGAKINMIRTDPSNRWVTNALPLAVEKGNIEIVRLLIGANADVNASAERSPTWHDDGYVIKTALLSAVWCESVELVKMLLGAGANVNARPQPSGGWTALQVAAETGNTELVETLLDAGADINAPAYNDWGRTALQAAVIEGHTELARRLLEAGADVNAPAAESGGVTALQGAAIKGQLGIALLLIQAGADPNAPPAESDGRTALQGAAEHGRLDMVQLLLNAGADISESHSARARELAEKNGHAVIAKLLKRF